MDCSLCIFNSFHYVDQKEGPSWLECDDKLPHRVVETDTGEQYGTDSTKVLAIKFAMLFVSNPIRLLPQVAYRIYDLLSGGFIHRAAANQTSCCKEFVITVAKFFLLPVGLIARQIICLLGLVFAFHARVWYGKVEQFFYMAPEDIFEAQPPLEMMGNVTAPCMQPKSFYKENNLFRYWDHHRYNPNTCRSLLFQITKADSDFPKDLQTQLSDLFYWNDTWEAQALANEVKCEFSGGTRGELPFIEELGQLLKETKEALNTDQYASKLDALSRLAAMRTKFKDLNSAIVTTRKKDPNFPKDLWNAWSNLFQARQTELGMSPDYKQIESLIEAIKKSITTDEYADKLNELSWLIQHRSYLVTKLNRAVLTLNPPKELYDQWETLFYADSTK